jgi:hypothetical protein
MSRPSDADTTRPATTRVPLLVYITPEFPEGRVAFSVAETARLLGIGQHAVRKAIKSGELYATRFNDRGLVIPTWSIEQLLGPSDGRAGGAAVGSSP